MNMNHYVKLIKVTAEVPSTISGTITEILVEAGQTVAIDTILLNLKLLMKRQMKQLKRYKQKWMSILRNLLKKLVQQWNRHLLLNKINHVMIVSFSPVV